MIALRPATRWKKFPTNWKNRRMMREVHDLFGEQIAAIPFAMFDPLRENRRAGKKRCALCTASTRFMD